MLYSFTLLLILLIGVSIPLDHPIDFHVILSYKFNCAQFNCGGGNTFIDSEHFLKLDNQLCFAIYACSREITRLYRPILDELGITYPQFLTLIVLWEHKTLTVKEIGELLYLDSGTLTPMLKRMELMNLVKRARGTEDERKVFIELTERGEQLKENALSLPEKCVPHFGLSIEQYLGLLTQMNQITQNIQKVTR